MRSRIWVLFGLALISDLAGVWTCAIRCEGVPRQAVAGTVTLDWKPLKSGMIHFPPTTNAQMTEAVAETKDGKCSIPRDKGLVRSDYKVSMFSTLAESGEIAQHHAGTLSMKEVIPPSFNTQTPLTVVGEDGVATLAHGPRLVRASDVGRVRPTATPGQMVGCTHPTTPLRRAITNLGP